MGYDTLGWEDAAGWTYGVPDALGSVRQAVDGSGAVIGAREWTPYGVEVGDAQAGLGYTGEWWDAAVGLQYLRARWYDARTGAFLTRDAVEENHPYQYANGNPILYTDPSGYDVGCPGGDASQCAVPPEGSHMLDLAVEACKQGGWQADCTLWEGARWYLYFTSSPSAAEEYVNGTGLGAGVEGQYRAAVAREWSQYLKYLGPNQGYEPAKDLRWWPTPDNPLVDPAEFQLFVAYASAGPAVAELSYELSCQLPWYAVDLGEDIYPTPGLWERSHLATGGRRTLYHYTSQEGLEMILNSQVLNPSVKANNPKDARYGDGQYLSDVVPGSRTPSQLSYDFLGMPFQGRRFTHYIQIDIVDLNVNQGRDGVYVVPGSQPLDLAGRIVSFGRVPGR